jgi:uncharacterized protein YwgA
MALKLDLRLDFVIKAFKLYKIVCKYYELKTLGLQEFKNGFDSLLSDEEKIIKAFSVVLDFIVDTFDLDTSTYSKESLKILELLETVTGIENIKDKSLTEITELLKAVQTETKEALTENFIQD